MAVAATVATLKSECLVWALVPVPAGGGLPIMRRRPVRLNGRSVPSFRATAVELRFRGHVDAFGLSHTEFDASLRFGGFSRGGIMAFRRCAHRGGIDLSFDRRVSDGQCGR